MLVYNNEKYEVYVEQNLDKVPSILGFKIMFDTVHMVWIPFLLVFITRGFWIPSLALLILVIGFRNGFKRFEEGNPLSHSPIVLGLLKWVPSTELSKFFPALRGINLYSDNYRG